jgi:hypothetical protein
MIAPRDIPNALKRRRFTAPVLALVVVAVAAPGASAHYSAGGPNPDEVALIAASQSGHHATQAPAVRPNPDEVGNGPRSVSAAELAALTQPQAAESNEAFDWGDAGIGAGAALLLTMIGTGFVVTARRQRAPTTA